MNKLDFPLPAYDVETPSDLLALHHTPINTSAEPSHRLIVLVPADADYSAVTHRVWKLAMTTGMRVQFLSLCKDAAQEPALRRALITLSALIRDGRVCADVRVEIGTNWVDVVKRNYQTGDMVVCFAEQRAGLLSRPLSQILQTSLHIPTYILSGLNAQSPSGLNWLSQVMVWVGSLGIIVASTFLQMQITSLAQDWVQTLMLILSVLGEVWLIWGWNSLFS